MIIERSIKVKNYKCFGPESQGFEKIHPINIIIGKNSSGKSSLVDLVEYVVKANENSSIQRPDLSKAKIEISEVISSSFIERAFEGNIEPNLLHVGKVLKYLLGPDKQKTMLDCDLSSARENIKNKFINFSETPFQGWKFKRITAERDISPQLPNESNLTILANGEGATNLIHQIIYLSQHDPKLIKKTLLDALNNIVNPDIILRDIQPRNIGNGYIEIFFEDSHNRLIALSKMGSGIKTILLVLLNLLVVPSVEHIKDNRLIFGFEELENNLHPSLQRKLFNYLSQYAEINKCYFFITTHSSVVIDLFSLNSNAQIIHIQSQGEFSLVKNIKTHNEGRQILRDLEFKASDLLLSNGVIWVEGPSDAIYLELLIDLYLLEQSNKNFSNLNYSIQCLSTAIWKYAGFGDFDWNQVDQEIENNIISLAGINHNHLVILDRDNNYEDKKPSDWQIFSNGTGRNKARLIFESIKFSNHSENRLETNSGDANDNQLMFWINDGTFETYLEHFVSTKGKDQYLNFFDSNKTNGYFEKLRQGNNSSLSKVELAAKISKFCRQNFLTFEDFAPKGSSLSNKMARLVNTVKIWNLA